MVRPEIPDYEIETLVGAGAFGQVWLAKQKLTGVYYAAKVISKNHFGDAELHGVRTFKQCAADHPHLVRIEHVGEIPTHYYYIMELADDARAPGLMEPRGYVPLTLEEELARRGSIDLPESAQIMQHVLEGLEHLHRTGVVHRDIKPANLMRSRGHWQLSDIGLTKRTTLADSYAGSPAYSPPEGVRDRSGDLYAAGKVLFEMATGALPKPEEFQAHLQRAKAFDSLPDLRALIAQACSDDPEQRIDDARAMREDVTACVSATRTPAELREYLYVNRNKILEYIQQCGGADNYAAMSTFSLIERLVDYLQETDQVNDGPYSPFEGGESATFVLGEMDATRIILPPESCTHIPGLRYLALWFSNPGADMAPTPRHGWFLYLIESPVADELRFASMSGCSSLRSVMQDLCRKGVVSKEACPPRHDAQQPLIGSRSQDPVEFFSSLGAIIQEPRRITSLYRVRQISCWSLADQEHGEIVAYPLYVEASGQP